MRIKKHASKRYFFIQNNLKNIANIGQEIIKMIMKSAHSLLLFIVFLHSEQKSESSMSVPQILHFRRNPLSNSFKINLKLNNESYYKKHG